MITRLQGGGGCQKWPQKGLRNICIAPNWYPVQVTSYFTFFFLKNVWQKCIFPSSFWGIFLLNYLDYLFFYTTNDDMLISSPKEDVKKVARKAGVRSGGWQNFTITWKFDKYILQFAAVNVCFHFSAFGYIL